MRILDRLAAWVARVTAVAELAKVVPYPTRALEPIVDDVARVLELDRIFVARELRRRVLEGDDLRTSIRWLAIARDIAMVEPLHHMWAIWFPRESVTESVTGPKNEGGESVAE
jgi:hypothetical protein